MALQNDLLLEQRLTQIDIGSLKMNMRDTIAKTIKEQSAKYLLSKSKVGKRWCKVYTSIHSVSKGPLTMHRNDSQLFEFQLK